MTDTLEPDDRFGAARARINAVREARARKSGGRTVDSVDGDLLRTWVRMKIAQNRGEVRPYHGSPAGFDALLDERLAMTRG